MYVHETVNFRAQLFNIIKFLKRIFCASMSPRAWQSSAVNCPVEKEVLPTKLSFKAPQFSDCTVYLQVRILIYIHHKIEKI